MINTTRLALTLLLTFYHAGLSAANPCEEFLEYTEVRSDFGILKSDESASMRFVLDSINIHPDMYDEEWIFSKESRLHKFSEINKVDNYAIKRRYGISTNGLINDQMLLATFYKFIEFNNNHNIADYCKKSDIQKIIFINNIVNENKILVEEHKRVFLSISDHISSKMAYSDKIKKIRNIKEREKISIFIENSVSLILATLILENDDKNNISEASEIIFKLVDQHKSGAALLQMLYHHDKFDYDKLINSLLNYHPVPVGTGLSHYSISNYESRLVFNNIVSLPTFRLDKDNELWQKALYILRRSSINSLGISGDFEAALVNDRIRKEFVQKTDAREQFVRYTQYAAIGLAALVVLGKLAADTPTQPATVNSGRKDNCGGFDGLAWIDSSLYTPLAVFGCRPY